MIKRPWQTAAVLASLAAASCSETKTGALPDPSAPSAGGMTDDVGDRMSCEGEERFDLDVETPLGYSGRKVLDWVEGRYRFPLHWSDPCDEIDACGGAKRCAALSGERPELGVAGTDTFMRVEVQALGTTAIASLPSAGQDECASSLRVPVAVRVESEDGAFALQFDGEAWSEVGRYALVSSDQLSRAGGTLLTELPAGAKLELGFGGGENDYWYFDMYVVTDSSEPPLLKGAVAGSCVGEGPRSEFLLP